MLAEPSQGAGLHARQAALLRGARRHLEAGHAAYMRATIQANRHLVRVHQGNQPGEVRRLWAKKKGPNLRGGRGARRRRLAHSLRRNACGGRQLNICMPACPPSRGV